jgi:WD40 repeat protein
MLTGHTDAVQDIDVSPDGRTLASAGNDGTPRLWDRATGTTTATLANLVASWRDPGDPQETLVNAVRSATSPSARTATTSPSPTATTTLGSGTSPPSALPGKPDPTSGPAEGFPQIGRWSRLLCG